MSESVQLANAMAVQLGVVVDGRIQPLLQLSHEQSVIDCPVNQAARHAHVFSTPNDDVVNGQLRQTAIQARPKIHVRLGLMHVSGTFWQPWQQHVLVSFVVQHYPSGFLVSINTEDVLGTISLTEKTQAYFGTISSIVEDIAKENGLTYLVEPTRGEWSMVQSRLSDGDFIVQRLMSRAVNDSGMAGFQCYAHDDVLHFHTVNYHAVIKKLNVLQVKAKTKIKVDVQGTANMGGSGINLVSVNPYTGKAIVKGSDRTKVHNFGNESPNVHTLGSMVRVGHVSTNGEDELVAGAQSTYEDAWSRAIVLELTFDHGLMLNLGDLVDLTLTVRQQHVAWSGLYKVIRLSHNVSSSAVSTVVVLSRGEFLVPVPKSGHEISGRPLRASVQAVTVNKADSTVHRHVTLRPMG